MRIAATQFGFAFALPVAGLFLVACDPVQVGDAHFWKGYPDAASIGQPDPSGSGGDTVVPDGSGGSSSVGSGGTTGSGGQSSATGGQLGSGGTVGSGGAVGGGGSLGVGTGGAAPVGMPGMLMVSVTTKSAGGRYSPDNVGAIWIADGASKFVKSLYVWGSRRRNDLSSWRSATSAAGLSNNLVDAVTAATMGGHGTRTANWNGTDVAKAAVPDGPYKVCFELRDGSGQSQCVDFMKSRAPQSVMPADTGPFTKRTIGYTP